MKVSELSRLGKGNNQNCLSPPQLEQPQCHNIGSLHSSALFSSYDYTQLASYPLQLSSGSL